MVKIKNFNLGEFDSYSYYPAIRTRPAEISGYKELSDLDKDRLIPIVSLGAWPRNDGLVESLAQLNDAVGERPFILDLTREATYQNQTIHDLTNPSDNFGQWKTFLKNQPNAIPVVQLAADAKLSQIIRQTRELEARDIGRIAFRIKNFLADTPRVINALASMDLPEHAIVVIDVGYIRDSIPASIAACVVAINDIRDEIPNAIITLVSSSFPSSFGGQSGSISILEREFHEAVGTDAVIYGDYSSIHARVYPSTGGKYVPRIDYPRYDTWEFQRRPNNDSTGYISAAKQMLYDFPSIAEEDTWGARKIVDASLGKIEGMKTPARWIAARVNMHISRQLSLSFEEANDDEGDDY